MAKKLSRLEVLRLRQREMHNKIATEIGRLKRKENARHIKQLNILRKLFDTDTVLGALLDLQEQASNQETLRRWLALGEAYAPTNDEGEEHTGENESESGQPFGDEQEQKGYQGLDEDETEEDEEEAFVEAREPVGVSGNGEEKKGGFFGRK